MLLGLLAIVASNIVIESVVAGVGLGTTIYCCSISGKTVNRKK